MLKKANAQLSWNWPKLGEITNHLHLLWVTWRQRRRVKPEPHSCHSFQSEIHDLVGDSQSNPTLLGASFQRLTRWYECSASGPEIGGSPAPTWLLDVVGLCPGLPVQWSGTGCCAHYRDWHCSWVWREQCWRRGRGTHGGRRQRETSSWRKDWCHPKYSLKKRTKGPLKNDVMRIWPLLCLPHKNEHSMREWEITLPFDCVTSVSKDIANEFIKR